MLQLIPQTQDAYENPEWQLRFVGNEGLELGLDVVTPVSWKVVLSRKTGNAPYSFRLPQPADKSPYWHWLKDHRGQTIVTSFTEFSRLIDALRGLVETK